MATDIPDSPRTENTDLKEFHDWIVCLCDPDLDICAPLQHKIKKIEASTQDELSAGNQALKRNIKNINFDGINTESGFNQVKEGSFRELRSDDSLLEGQFQEDKPHGFIRLINEFGDLEFFGCVVNGVLQGECWRSLAGGGFLISRSWDFSGEEVLYLYPDCRLGLKGRFEECRLVSGALVEVTGFSSILEDSVLVPETIIISDQKYCEDVSTEDNLSSYPHLPDPYEALFVEVKESRLPNAGQGLFAKTDLDMGTVVSFYNGVKVKAGKVTDYPTPYSIALDEQTDLDIPESFQSLASYSATLGHKVCHSFEANCDVDTFFHPRFGTIRCITTLQDLNQDDELTINYRYNFVSAPSWYKVAWAKHQKMVRGLPDWKEAVLTSSTPDQPQQLEEFTEEKI